MLYVGWKIPVSMTSSHVSSIGAVNFFVFSEVLIIWTQRPLHPEEGSVANLIKPL